MDGAPVREYAHQFLMRHARPHTNAAGIHVYERRSGGRIEPDAAALQPQADLAQMFERHAGDVEVERVAEHVLTKARYAAAAPPQHRIGLRCAVAADHLDRLVGAGLALNLPD